MVQEPVAAREGEGKVVEVVGGACLESQGCPGCLEVLEVERARAHCPWHSQKEPALPGLGPEPS